MLSSAPVGMAGDFNIHQEADQVRGLPLPELRCSVVDPNKCIGCGICTTKCEFDAIHLKRGRPQNSKMVPAEDKFKMIVPYAAKRKVKSIKQKDQMPPSKIMPRRNYNALSH